jgi:hypothetical protein
MSAFAFPVAVAEHTEAKDLSVREEATTTLVSS